MSNGLQLLQLTKIRNRRASKLRKLESEQVKCYDRFKEKYDKKDEEFKIFKERTKNLEYELLSSLLKKNISIIDIYDIKDKVSSVEKEAMDFATDLKNMMSELEEERRKINETQTLRLNSERKHQRLADLTEMLAAEDAKTLSTMDDADIEEVCDLLAVVKRHM